MKQLLSTFHVILDDCILNFNIRDQYITICPWFDCSPGISMSLGWLHDHKELARYYTNVNKVPVEMWIFTFICDTSSTLFVNLVCKEEIIPANQAKPKNNQTDTPRRYMPRRGGLVSSPRKSN